MTTAQKVQPRLKERYRSEIRDALRKQSDRKSVV